MKDFGTLRRHLWALPLELVMAVAAAVMASQQNWLLLITAVFTCAVSFLPLLVERLWRVRIPALIQMMYVAFIFISMFSGEVLSMYARVEHWDDMVHFISGILLGFAGVLCLVELARRRHIKMPAWLQATCVCCFAVSIAVLWEIVEFTSDRLFGTFSQGGSLEDTMFDLMDGTLGSLVVAGLFALYINGRHVPVLGRMIAMHVRHNR